MTMDLATVTPGRQELEAMSLAMRMALEDVFDQAHDLIRQLNDDEIARLVGEGKTQAQVAELAGCRQQRVSEACIRMGVEPASKRGRPRNTDPGNSNGDGPVEDAEVVDGEVVDEPERPEHYMPDVVDAAADQNVRTQALRWFEQGRHIEELIEGGAVVEPRSRDDKAAIKREAAEMARIARRLKGAF